MTRATSTAITVGTNQTGVQITPDCKTAFVTNNGGTTLTPIDVGTKTAGTPITVGTSPHGVGITPDRAPFAALSVMVGGVVQPTSFDASASTVQFWTIASYAWNFGDGTPAVTTATPTTTNVWPGRRRLRVSDRWNHLRSLIQTRVWVNRFGATPTATDS